MHVGIGEAEDQMLIFLSRIWEELTLLQRIHVFDCKRDGYCLLDVEVRASLAPHQ